MGVIVSSFSFYSFDKDIADKLDGAKIAPYLVSLEGSLNLAASGASLVTLSSAELLVALQTGVIDGVATDSLRGDAALARILPGVERVEVDLGDPGDGEDPAPDPDPDPDPNDGPDETPNQTGDPTSGVDILTGTSGRDEIRLLGGDDTFDAKGGRDKVEGNSGNDTISGGGGKDKLIGGAGNDVLNGDGGNDRLLGGKDDDILNGGKGRDVLVGGAGDDILNGNAGNAVLKGGAGSDTFQFEIAGKSSTVTVKDFDGFEDRVQASENFSELALVEGGLEMRFGDTHKVFFEGAEATDQRIILRSFALIDDQSSRRPFDDDDPLILG